MRSEFEKAYEPNPNKSPFTEVRFNDEKQIYEPLNTPIDHVARSLNSAWYGYRIRQTEVDELQKQLIDQGQRFNEQAQYVKDLEHKNDELQKRVDAVKQLIKYYKDEEKELELKEWEQSTIYGRFAIELEQALKGGNK